MSDWRIKGQYLKNCNCIPNCPCETWGYPAPHKHCEGVSGMHILEGSFGDVDLSGLTWVITYHWPGALHDGDGTVEVFIDDRADPAQREALQAILSGEAGGPLFEIIASVVSTVHGPFFVPIEWHLDKDARRARVAVAGRVETVTAPLVVPATGEEQRVGIRLPDGFEYKETEVAQSTVLTSTGENTFDWTGTHSSLADVEHTNEQLVA